MPVGSHDFGIWNIISRKSGLTRPSPILLRFLWIALGHSEVRRSPETSTDPSAQWRWLASPVKKGLSTSQPQRTWRDGDFVDFAFQSFPPKKMMSYEISIWCHESAWTSAWTKPFIVVNGKPTSNQHHEALKTTPQMVIPWYPSGLGNWDRKVSTSEPNHRVFVGFLPFFYGLTNRYNRNSHWPVQRDLTRLCWTCFQTYASLWRAKAKKPIKTRTEFQRQMILPGIWRASR